MLAQRIQNSGGFQKKMIQPNIILNPPRHIQIWENESRYLIFVFFQDAEFFLWVTDEIRFCGGVFLYFYDCLFVFLAWDQIFWPRRLRFLKFCCWFTDPELARMSADWQFCQRIRGSFKIEKCSKPSNCIQNMLFWQSVVILEPRHAGPWKEPLLN